MRIICISDTHGLHNKMTEDLPEGDIIIHAGDVSNYGTPAQVSQFLEWFDSLDYRHKIFIAGNHDFFFDLENKELVKDYLSDYPDIRYLHNSGLTIGKTKIWGSPYTPVFGNWAFMKERGEEIKKEWDKIPEDVDILITHGPPYKVQDLTFFTNEHVGCEELLESVKRIKPKYHIFGHIHEGHGKIQSPHTEFVNASICTDKYKPVNKPLIINL